MIYGIFLNEGVLGSEVSLSLSLFSLSLYIYIYIHIHDR